MSSSSSLEDVCRAAQNVDLSSENAKIRQAGITYRLFLATHRDYPAVNSGYQQANGRRTSHIRELESQALNIAGGTKDETYHNFCRDLKKQYYFGGRWCVMVSWFGGQGVVLFFVMAGSFDSLRSELLFFGSG